MSKKPAAMTNIIKKNCIPIKPYKMTLRSIGMSFFFKKEGDDGNSLKKIDGHQYKKPLSPKILIPFSGTNSMIPHPMTIQTNCSGAFHVFRHPKSGKWILAVDKTGLATKQIDPDNQQTTCCDHSRNNSHQSILDQIR
jgi:hypothetical protein